MSVQAYDAGAVTTFPRSHPGAMSLPRSQVGIERLPARRLSNEPRESMNCKSCRKRKVTTQPPHVLSSLGTQSKLTGPRFTDQMQPPSTCL